MTPKARTTAAPPLNAPTEDAVVAPGAEPTPGPPAPAAPSIAAPNVASPQLAPTPTPPPVATGRTNGLAIASLVLGVLGFSVIPIVLGHVALAQIRKTGDGGSSMAVVGLVLGYLGLIVWIVVAVLLVIGLGWATVAGNGRGF